MFGKSGLSVQLSLVVIVVGAMFKTCALADEDISLIVVLDC